MAEPTQIDHVVEALNKLPSQWENITSVRGLLESLTTPINTLEQNLFDMKESFNVNTAVGDQLDMLGELVGESRYSQTDDEFRQVILAQTTVNSGSGTPNDLLGLLAFLSNTDKTYIWEHYPLCHIMYTNSVPSGITTNVLYANRVAGTDAGWVIFDPNEDCFAPADLVQEDAFLVTEAGDNIVTEAGDTLVVTSNVAGADNDFNRASFPDETEAASTRPLAHVGYRIAATIDTTGLGGYGDAYGIDYGGT